MSRGRELTPWETKEIARIIDRNLERLKQPSSRRAFRDITAVELGMTFNLSMDQARFLVDLHRFEPWNDPRTDRPEPGPHPGFLLTDIIHIEGPETSLEEEHARQAKVMASLFAQKLNLTEKEYIASLPPFPKYPLAGNPMARPLLVEGTRIHWEEQATLSGIDIGPGFGVMQKDWLLVVPEKPFATWVSVAHKKFGKFYDVLDVRGILKPNDRFAGVTEGIAFWNSYPKAASVKPLDLEGSRNPGHGLVNHLDCTTSPAKLDVYFRGDYLDSDYRMLISSQNINVAA